MSKILLDTNICIYIINNKPEWVKKRFEEFKRGEICICSITVAELFFGVEKSKYKENNLLALKSFIANLEVLDFGINEAIVYSKLRVDLEKRKQLIGAMDMLIASVAIANSLTLITNNTKEFVRILDLNIENWA